MPLRPEACHSGKTVAVAYLSDNEHVWCRKATVCCLYRIYRWRSHSRKWAREPNLSHCRKKTLHEGYAMGTPVQPGLKRTTENRGVSLLLAGVSRHTELLGQWVPSTFHSSTFLLLHRSPSQLH
ncbi:hypothetical protein AV530_009268 [Patagioenas fasciata monilis]|uniref:Uncharacterized protein n=1 Tax=Patagioenas fasciata monilis TaxID=372326 RepID=A0A1V4JJH3_PATFA|nr:hypothetical protein AV530_009268 [Patagioenas fasciata monilis]